jgi:hypothetical protein
MNSYRRLAKAELKVAIAGSEVAQAELSALEAKGAEQSLLAEAKR